MKRPLLWLAAALAISACSPASHRAAPPPSPPDSTTTSTTAPAAPASPFSWDRDNGAALNLGGGAAATLSAVIAPEVNQPWQVFGTRLSPSGTAMATRWSSPDAQTWTAEPLVAGEPDSQIDAAAEFRGSTVAVGAIGAGPSKQAMVWTSRAGATFSTANVPPTVGPSSMREVTGGALGFFATGTINGRFALWGSTDGRTWTEVQSAERVITSQAGATVDALLSVGDNVYAAGWVQPGAVPQAAVWSTTDGLDWTQVNSAATSFTSTYGEAIYSLSALNSSGSGLVAAGAIDGGAGWEPASWISPNGESWSLPSTDFPATPQAPGGATDLGPAGGTAVMSVATIPTLDGSTSMVASGGGPYGQTAWTSTDGLHWASLSMPASYAASASWSAGVIAASGTTTIVADPQPGQPYLLTDTAGTWREPSAAVFGPVRPVAIPVSLHRGPSGLILTVESVNRPPTIGPPTLNVSTLASTDGRSWQAATPAQVAQVQPATEPTAGALSAAMGGGWVAVSTGNDATPDVYRSPDGRTWTKESTLSPPFTSAQTTPTSVAQNTTTSSGATSVTLPPRSEAPGYSVNGLCVDTLPPSSATPTTTSSIATTTTTAATASGTASTTAGTSLATVPAETAVAVGAGQFVPAASLTETTGAAAWHDSLSHWSLATVSQSLPPGSGQVMTGCFTEGNSLYAYGVAAASSGAPVPAIWRSADGSSWSRQNSGAFDTDDATPLTSVAAAGRYWVAVATPDPQAAPFQAGVFGAAGPGSDIVSDAAFGPAPSADNGQDGLWLSSDSGGGWQQVDTSAAPWAGAQQTALDLTAFAGSGSPVVVGAVDGRLAVWTGTAAAPATGP